MEFMDILSLVLSIVAGVGACIPLAIQLVKYIKAAIVAKNFGNIMKIALDLMPEAEEKFSTGEERKAYVMDNIKSLSATLEYEVDLNAISEMIDAICQVSKKVNVKVDDQTEQ